MRTLVRLLSVSSIALVLAASARAELVVLGHAPAKNALGVDPHADVVVDFDRAVMPASLPPVGGPTFRVFGTSSGAVAGTLTLEAGDTRLRFDPATPLFAGEAVRVVMTEDLRAADGTFLRDEGYVVEFRVRARPSSASFTQTDSISVRDFPGTSVRLYGGLATDFDHDGFVDIATVNEDASDIRVLMSSGDCAGGFTTFLTPTAVGAVPSPNFADDFDLDGDTDMVTSDVLGDTISIALGNGDGTFTPTIQYSSGAEAHGMCVLDANGDGAMDVLTANILGNDVSLLINDGTGHFLGATTFDGGCSGEWGIAAADFDEDGILDFVVGCRNSQNLVVHLGNGDGTFTAQPAVAVGGLIWMIVTGDVNGDGHADVATANGQSGEGSILLGDGMGGLGSLQSHPASLQTVATDLGDLDGDGDLDWILSDFGGGTYSIYENDGTGTFSLAQTLFAPSNASDCEIVDLDNDQDMDLVLFDEIADVAVILENDDGVGDSFCDGRATACPCGNVGLPCRGCESSAGRGGVHLTPLAYMPDGGGSGSAQLLGEGFPVMGSPAVVAIRSALQQNGGAGSIFGDGLLCVGAPVVRLGAAFAIGGSVTLGVGHGAGAGTFHYQLWYRNTGGFCTADMFNLSNGMTLVWP